MRLAFVAGLVIASPAGAAEGNVGIRLLEAPSARAEDPRARQYIVDHVAPGTELRRRFEITNSTANPQDMQLYAGSASLHDGAFVFGDGRTANELTGWAKVEPPSLLLAPGAAGTGTVTIAVPPGASGGERYGVVWAELPGATGPDGITLVNRVGIRIYLSVGAAAEPPTNFRLDTFTPSLGPDGRARITIAACNDGGRAVDLEGDVNLSEGPGGTSAGPFPSQGATTFAPGECGQIPVDLAAGLPRGPWKARVKLHSGAVVRESEAPVTFPAAGAGPAVAPPVKAVPVVTGTGWGRLWLLLAIVALLVIAAALAFFWWRSRQQREAVA